MSNISNGEIFVIGVGIFCTIILLLVLYRYTFDKSYNKTTKYYVVTRHPNRYEAANILHNLNIFSMKLLDKMYTKYQNNPKAMEFVNNLINKYDPDYLEENDPTFTVGHKTFTLNFQRISICLRKKNGEFYDMNTLQFVMMHELSHIAALEKNHDDRFWMVFKFILRSAEELVGYVPVQYEQYPFVYCGITVSHNPYFSEYDLTPFTINTARHDSNN